MHGGGFIALSSRSMQVYTRRWANELDVPVISIDYRMPPDHPYPQAPQDCLRVYQFVTQHIHKYMNIQPKEIILAGDSAGGNLVCSLTGMILKHKEVIPKALYISYPSTDLRLTFSQSRLYAFTDPLLWPSVLLLCLNSYTKNNLNAAEDPLASPILLTEEYVGGAVGDQRFPLKWPRTMIAVGMKDPLYDDSLLLMQKMVESNINCSCNVYEDLSHGFLNTEIFLPKTSITIENSIKQLEELLNASE